MEILKSIVEIIGFLFVTLGVMAIYDARNLTKKWFSFGDQNEGAKVLKVMGFIISIVGGLTIFFIL